MKSLICLFVFSCSMLISAPAYLQTKDPHNHPSGPAAYDPSKDPFKVAPQAYKLEFENEWVRVTRVHYGPKEKIADHYHTDIGTAYVYLNDSGPVVFKHRNLPYGDITRPPTKAGSFRLYRGLKEVHGVENTTDSPSDFLRVEFKTDPVNENSLRGKFYREQFPAGENYRKIQFENEQVRIIRVVIASRKTVDLSAAEAEPALLIALTSSRLKRPNVREQSLEMGKAVWLRAGQQDAAENIGSAPAELLRFEFKTKPR